MDIQKTINKINDFGQLVKGNYYLNSCWVDLTKDIQEIINELDQKGEPDE